MAKEILPAIYEADFPVTRFIVFESKPDSWPKNDPRGKLKFELKVTFETIADVVDAAEKYVKWSWQTKARTEKITNDRVHKFVYGERIKTVAKPISQQIGEMNLSDLERLIKMAQEMKAAKEMVENNVEEKEDLSDEELEKLTEPVSSAPRPEPKSSGRK